MPPIRTPPPQRWLDEQAATGVDAVAALAKWISSDKKFRDNTKARLASKKRTVDKAMKRIAEGATDSKTLNLVKYGGRRSYATREDANAANQQSYKDSDTRKLAAVLEFRLKHSTGCTIAGCPLGTASGTTSKVPLCLLEHDHAETATKSGNITHMTPTARAAELEKTSCVCMWHHFLHTREQRGDGTVESRDDKVNRDVGKLKAESGCQHPLHDSMPYAILVPTHVVDPLVVGFLEVSHLNRGGTHGGTCGSNTHARSKAYLKDLSDGTAVVHCAFCHVMWTQCERFKMHPDTPNSKHQSSLMRSEFGPFMDHFEKATAATDWVAVANMSKRK